MAVFMNLFEIAKVAGIQGAKRCHDLIPLCHPLFINYIDITLEIDHEATGIRISSRVRLDGKTGAEIRWPKDVEESLVRSLLGAVGG